MRLERWKRKIAHWYLKPFKKLFPYMDLKNEITLQSQDRAYDIVKNLVSDTEELSRKVIKEFADADKAYKKEMAQEVLDGDKEYKKKTVQEFLDTNQEECKEIVLNQINKKSNIRKELDRDFAEGIRIIYGKIEKVMYSQKKRLLYAVGFFLPVSAYDTISLYCDDVYIGDAYTGVVRKEFVEEYPAFHTVNAGWQFYSEYLDIEHPKCLKVLLKKNGKEIGCYSKEIEYSDNFLKVSNKPYWIDMNSVELRDSSVHKRIERFNGICYSLANWMPWNEYTFFKKFMDAKEEIAYGKKDVEEIFIDIFSDGNIIQFKNAKLEYQDANKLWIIINEILIHQEYYFEAPNDSPFIIDGGGNIGLAVFYFLSLYPDSEIISFEPSQEAYAILKKNAERNNWMNVTILPYALDLEERERRLLVPKNDCLGASLTERAKEYNKEDTIKEEMISCKKLSSYITKPVDFLKLDVEGVEVRILREISTQLSMVSHIFCEYHYGELVEDNDFCELIRILDEQEFKYQVSKSPNYQQMTGKKTMSYIGKRVSLNLWARKKKCYCDE